MSKLLVRLGDESHDISITAGPIGTILGGDREPDGRNYVTEFERERSSG